MMDDDNVSSNNLAITTRDGRLKVEFVWQQDRFIHRLYLDNIDVGQSVDGDGEQDWPPSPPIQQLSLEEINGANVLLGVGAAGRAHWSISVESTSENELKFDLACRSKARPKSLSSTYSVMDSIEVSSLGRTKVSSDHEKQRTVSVTPEEMTAATSQWSYRITVS